MSDHANAVTKPLAVVAVILLVGAARGQRAYGDFILWNDEQILVNTSHSQGILYDRSRASIIFGGSVSDLYAYNSSSTSISAGSVTWLYAYDSAGVDVSGGSVYALDANGSSSATIRGGSVSDLDVLSSSTASVTGGSVYDVSTYGLGSLQICGGSVSYVRCYGTSFAVISAAALVSLYPSEQSEVHISGGSLANLGVYDQGAVTFHARDFRLGEGLSLDGERVLGTGLFSGEWMDGTRWAVDIVGNASGATIFAIPEPSTLALLSVGVSLGLGRRRRR